MDLSPLSVSGLFFVYPADKKKPAVDVNAGFPVFSHPSSRSGFLWSDNERKTRPRLHAVQHLIAKEKPAG
jgi:hypothetical protein